MTVKSIGRLVMAALTSLLVAQVSSASPTVSISPAVTVATVGSAVDLMVDISDVADLFAFQFDLSFDPAVLAATSIDEGLFLQSGGTTFFLPGTIENTLGVISFTANSLIGAIPGVSGDGTLAIANFFAIGPGTSAISLSGVSLLDSSLADISFSTSSGRVEVTGTIPEPTSMLLVGVALAVAGLSRRRRLMR